MAKTLTEKCSILMLWDYDRSVKHHDVLPMLEIDLWNVLFTSTLEIYQCRLNVVALITQYGLDESLEEGEITQRILKKAKDGSYIKHLYVYSTGNCILSFFGLTVYLKR